MDEQMIGRLLQTYGVQQPNVRQANAAREFFATNPEIAEKRAMGMRGSGIDDNSDIFGAQLDKLIQDSSIQSQPLPALPTNGAPIETVQQATTPNAPRKRMEPIATQAAPYNAEQNLGPTPAQDASGTPGWLTALLTAVTAGTGLAGRHAADAMGRAASESTNTRMRDVDIERRNGGQGVRNAATNDPRVPAAAKAAMSEAPAPYGTDLEWAPQKPTPTTKGEKSTAVPTSQQTPEEVAALKAAVEAENQKLEGEMLQRQIQQQNETEKLRKQTSTSKLLKAGSRAVRGR